jgi:methionine-gamma-lyase
MGGVVCSTQEFIDELRNVNDGASMLLGASMDSMRAASILKNLRTLHIRIKQHSKNALYLAKKFEDEGLRTVYPGLESHPGHKLFKQMMNKEYGFGGMLTLDVGSLEKANAFMELMQERNLGYLAVSLGFYKTLFSAPGTSTSSEIPEEEQQSMGLSPGLVRFSIGLDDDIERTYRLMHQCMYKVGILDSQSKTVPSH